VLREAEPVPGVVPEHGLDPVRPLRRLLEELHAVRRQLLVGLPDVVGLPDPAAERTLRHQRTDMLGALLVVHGRPRLVQDELEVRLVGRPHRQPPELVHGRVGADLEAQLLRVERLRGVLVQDGDPRVREPLDHVVLLPSATTSKRRQS